MDTKWNPHEYRVRKERAQPFFDLLALVRPAPGLRAIDLGCGNGELTAHMHSALQAERTLGVDSSEAMLTAAAAFASPPALKFERADIATLASAWSRDPKGRFDLALSNAALQWLPSHEKLLSRITRALAPRGQLAVQIPSNDDHPTHTIAAALAIEPEFRGSLAGFAHGKEVLTPEAYAQILYQLGYIEQHVRLVVYAHPFASRDDVVDWLKGTLLSDYEKRMSPALYARFLARYRKLLYSVLPNQWPYFYPFKRILFWGVRP